MRQTIEVPLVQYLSSSVKCFREDFIAYILTILILITNNVNLDKKIVFIRNTMILCAEDKTKKYFFLLF